MKYFFEYLGLGVIIVFSFFYTEKAALIVQNKNPIMQEIVQHEKSLKVDSVDAIINGDYIIPGFNGLEIDVNASFKNMKSFGAFNSYYLIFTQVKPNVSLEDNRDKIIKSGNPTKKAVSLVFESIGELSNYALSNNIEFNMLIEENEYPDEIMHKVELINNEYDSIKFSNVESILNKDKKNKNICLLNKKNAEICKKYKNYLVKESIVLTNINVVEVKKKISNGQIILIKDNAKLEDLKIVINQIKYKGIDIVFLSKLISEEIA